MRARGEAVRHVVPAGSGTMAVREWRFGSAEDPEPLLLLHGFAGSGRSFEHVAPRLSYRGRILAPDLPGHGDTRYGDDSRAYAMEAVAEALDAVLAKLGAPRVALHGYSMGGRLALYYAVSRPARVTRLVLESASAGIAGAAERSTRVRSDEELARYALAHGIQSFVDRWEKTPVLALLRCLPVEERRRLREIRLANDPAGLAASLRGMGVGAQPFLGERLHEIVVPTLVIAGVKDVKFGAIARELAMAIRAAELVLLSECGHTPHLEAPERWAEVVGTFMHGGSTAA